MSYIRPTSERKYSKGEKGLYAFLSGPHKDTPGEDYFVESYDRLHTPEDYVEITCRIMKRAGVKLTAKDINKIRKELELEPIDFCNVCTGKDPEENICKRCKKKLDEAANT